VKIRVRIPTGSATGPRSVRWIKLAQSSDHAYLGLAGTRPIREISVVHLDLRPKHLAEVGLKGEVPDRGIPDLRHPTGRERLAQGRLDI